MTSNKKLSRRVSTGGSLEMTQRDGFLELTWPYKLSGKKIAGGESLKAVAVHYRSNSPYAISHLLT